eukprot:TRINITY_DN30237_c0_g1_i1.p1 TRINITY_DN30237_c0_g1~~TRINITY_DN30237_c0_g1_i1.p1  ORF type:complete len:354 (-),score=49.80 TRINITY_DN30237_c0_g1_i1:374-1435(-)
MAAPLSSAHMRRQRRRRWLPARLGCTLAALAYIVPRRVGQPSSHCFAAVSQPSWLPSSERLKELAAGEKPLAFHCLRQADGDSEASCACEVRTSKTDCRTFNYFLSSGVDSTPRVWSCTVNELPFSEGKLGGHLWDGGVLMSIWATTNAEGRGLAAGGAELLRGHRVLELGSGVGLLGLALIGAGIAASLVLTDFGPTEDRPLQGAAAAQRPQDRLIPGGLLSNLRDSLELNGISTAEVRHLDWHEYIEQPGLPAAPPEERFERVVAADVVYYLSDLAALCAAMAAHLVPGGRAFILVPVRDWRGPLASERATAEDLVAGLQPYGSVHVHDLMGHCGTLEGSPVKIVDFTRGA